MKIQRSFLLFLLVVCCASTSFASDTIKKNTKDRHVSFGVNTIFHLDPIKAIVENKDHDDLNDQYFFPFSCVQTKNAQSCKFVTHDAQPKQITVALDEEKMVEQTVFMKSHLTRKALDEERYKQAMNRHIFMLKALNEQGDRS